MKTTTQQQTRLEKLNCALFEEMQNTDNLKPRLTAAKIMAFIFAMVIHSITVMLVFIGIYYLYRMTTAHNASIFTFGLFSVLTLGAAWAFSPRFLLKEPSAIMPRKEFPTLYSLTDRVAACLDTPPVYGIQFGAFFNATFHAMGVKQKTILTIGIPLWVVLSDQEKIALIAHELAHGANGDYRRSLIVYSAYHTLEAWYRALFVPTPNGAMVLMSVAGVVWIFLSRFQRLMFHESRRAEYLADLMASTVSGTHSTTHMLAKVGFQLEFPKYIRKLVETRRSDHILDKFRTYITDMPEEKLAEIDRIRLEKDRLYNFTHPPLDYRIAFLKAHPTTMPQIQLSEAESIALKLEFAAIEKQISNTLLKQLPNSYIVG